MPYAVKLTSTQRFGQARQLAPSRIVVSGKRVPRHELHACGIRESTLLPDLAHLTEEEVSRSYQTPAGG